MHFQTSQSHYIQSKLQSSSNTKFQSKHSMKPSIYTGFDVIHNLQLPIPLDPPQPKEHGVLIGREWRPTGELPYSRSHPLPTLDYKSLASQQLSYFITRSDCNKQIWEICTCPRRKDGHTKQTELKQLGQVLQNICAANNDLPPIATSQAALLSGGWRM